MQYVYLQSEKGEIFDLKLGQDSDDYSVTLDNKVNINNLKVIAIDEDSGKKVVYE